MLLIVQLAVNLFQDKTCYAPYFGKQGAGVWNNVLAVNNLGDKVLQQAEYKDSDDCNWGDVTDKEPENTEDADILTECTTVGEFLVDIGPLEMPADKQDCKQAAKSHEDVGREVVEEVKDCPSEELHIRKRTE